MKKRISTTLSIIGIILSACNSTRIATKKTIYISSETAPCDAGVIQKECLQVKWTKDQTKWDLFYDNIEGFSYEKGNEYNLVISEHRIEKPPADAASVKYTLIKEISKTKVKTKDE